MQKVRMALFAGLAMGALGAGTAVASPFTISSVQGGAATGSVRYNFDNMTLTGASGPVSSQVVAPSLGDASLAMRVNITPNARVVQGSVGGQFAAPFLSLNNGQGFGAGGTNQAAGANATTYLTAGSTNATAGAQIELLLPFEAQYFGLLWGSIDGYNTLRFFNGVTQVGGSITGANVTANPNGAQNRDGTRYVEITSSLAFNRVVFTSTQFAFEFDNVALARGPGGADPSIIPAPAALGLFALGLVGLAALRRQAR
jgi:hypothetical protein